MVKSAIEKLSESGFDASDILAQFLTQGAERMAGDIIIGDEVEFHDRNKIVLPRGMGYKKARAVLDRLEEEANTPTDFRRKFMYRPDDGAYATFQVLKQMFGMVLGKPQMTFFGLQPAEQRVIKIGPGQTMQVPWGALEVPTMRDTIIHIGETNDEDYGRVFYIVGQGPKRYKDDIEAMFNAVEQYLLTNSIYRGRAIIGSDSPDFLDLTAFDANTIVFSDEVNAVLDGTIWAPLRYAEQMRAEGVPLKRAVLLHGPYGTGKSSAGLITAQVAVDNSWTFISAKPGRDKVQDVLRTARLYQPSVVFVEDIDGATSSGDSDEVTKFLDAFDGIGSKGGELMAVMTTNHLEKIHKGMLRPGRLDAVVKIAELDRPGVERLIQALVTPSKLAEDIDYDEVYESMKEFLPAFIRESVNRAVTLAISAAKGSTNYVIKTQDLVYAAHSLMPQLEALNEAGEGERTPTLDRVVKDAMTSAVLNIGTYDENVGAHTQVKDMRDQK